MLGKAVYKVPNGKLLKLSLELEENKIKSIRVMGDFFMHPEAGIELIEAALVGQEIDEKLVGLIDNTARENGIEMFGLDSKAVFEAIKIAVGNAK